MSSKGVKQTPLAEATGISQAAINNYLNKDRIPGVEELCRLADYFDVSTDHLLGREAGHEEGHDRGLLMREGTDVHRDLEIWRKRAKAAERQLADLRAGCTRCWMLVQNKLLHREDF